MRTCLVILLAAASIFGFMGSASALTFTLESFAVTANSSDPGLVLNWNPVMTTTHDFNLEVGQSAEIALFDIGTAETWANLDDIFWREISVGFDFLVGDAAVSGSVTGETRGRFLFQDGVARWDGPAEFSFGDGGLFTVTLSPVTFDLPGTAGVSANINYLQASASGLEAAPVPEPATLLLLGSGLVGITVIRRKKLFRKAA